jgi:[ribosomal protein S5]-alanine N-acetyltransferase
MRSIPQLTEPLTDGRVRVRMATERDIPEILIAYQDDPQLHVRLGEERPPSGAQLGSRAEETAAALTDGTHVELTITEPDADDCVGQVFAVHFDWEHLRAELGIWLAPQVRGRRMAPPALKLIAGWLFDACGLRRLQLFTHPDNEPMLRAAAAAGFQYEGLLHGYTRERGRRQDLAVLSLLPTDP